MIKSEDLQSLQQGHRERLRKKFIAGQLSEYETLELLLTYAIPRRDVRILSRQLFKKYRSIHNLISEPFESLITNEGIKESTATLFKLILKLTEFEYKKILDDAPIFHNYDKLINYCQILLCGKTIEEFHVFYLDGEYRLLADELHSSGTVDWAAVYVREIAKRALNLNARHVVLVHNHPGVQKSFSTQDIQITQELERVLKPLEIKLHDHLLVSGGTVYSARNMHLLDIR